MTTYGFLHSTFLSRGAVAGGGEAGLFREHVAETVLSGEAAPVRNLGNGQAGFREQPFRLFKAVILDGLPQGLPLHPQETQFREAARHAEIPDDVRDADAFASVCLDVGLDATESVVRDMFAGASVKKTNVNETKSSIRS